VAGRKGVEMKHVCYLKEGMSISSHDQRGRYQTQCGKRRANVTINKERVTCPDCTMQWVKGINNKDDCQRMADTIIKH